MSSFDFKMAGAVHIPSDIQKELKEKKSFYFAK